MNIAIDLRSLQSGSVSGVENYIINLLAALLEMDKSNSYTLFYNSFRNTQIKDLKYVNSKLVKTHYPNRLLNMALKLKAVNLEKFVDEFDCLFMPNLNQFNILPSAKLAITVHDLSPVVTPEFYNFKRQLWHRLLGFRQAFERANVIFAVSEYTKMDLIRLFDVPAEKIKVIYPGIDHKVFNTQVPSEEKRKIRNQYDLPGDYILFLNTIEPRKNLSGLLHAFEQLEGDTELVIVGKKGWKFKSIFEEIKKSKKSAKIRYMGYVEERDKPILMSMAKMLVYPSFYEGFGFQPLESQALGVPTVVSQVTALPEVVGNASLLVNPNNVDDIRKAMESLLPYNLLRMQLIARGLEQVKKYSWQKTAEQVLAHLNSI